MNARWQGFGERMKRLNPIWNLASGMQLAGLKDYAQMLALSVLLEVFYREIENNPDRKKQDLFGIVKSCANTLKIEDETEQSEELIQRFVDGLLWSGQAELHQPFSAKWFDEKDQEMKDHRFRYLVEDRETSQWEKGGKTVYRCSDEAKELIFMSREILQELEITIDQLYIEHLVKNGHFQQALSGLDDLMARVKRMIARELEYRESMKRNPKIIFQQEHELRSGREQEVKQQFQEEKTRFQQMRMLLQRISTSNQHYEISEKLDQTRRIHDQFAGHVIENMRLEIELRYEFPNLFWRQQQISFQKSYFQDWLLTNGVPEPDDMAILLEPLFSAQPHFIYPLDWSWMEQDTEVLKNEISDKLVEEKEEIVYQKREVNWEKIVRLWEPLFVELTEKGECQLVKLRDIPNVLQEKWLEQKEAIDLWLLFHSESITLSSIDVDKEVSDERLQLIHHLVRKQTRFMKLEGKTITSFIDAEQSMIHWKGVSISPFVLRLT
ncbi:hypothetical protein [Pseudoneobacillus rhizosphaerae]|uniref:Uncharacterized protein n=1 Tax=Pseudoneobacillus rhizosphaerae TaxID=2880968 RepID=A0A9C7GBV3_9BACI|nr:hypothetical protein [Pseudoneobacillus rhizosphaerae]CAG9609463.1 hypothetical protein NEOCIP111885_03205 [Pseudoneobacillus rhizosphaerae]